MPRVLRRWAGARAVTDRPSAKRRATGIWLGLGSALVLVALARPQWGNLEEVVFDQSREVLIALDLSASMLAEDAIKAAVKDFKSKKEKKAAAGASATTAATASA